MDPNARESSQGVVVEPTGPGLGRQQEESSGSDGVMAKLGSLTEKVGGRSGGSGFDLRGQITQRPLLAVGVGLVGGMLVGGRTGGKQSKGDQPSKGDRSRGSRRHGPGDYARKDRPPFLEGSAQAYRSSQGMSGGLQGGLASAAKKSGLDETLSRAATSLMGALNERTRSTLSQQLPGFEERLRQRQATSSAPSTNRGADAASG
jgi:hypothetical protein